MNRILITFAILSFSNLLAQKVTISGYVRDADSDETLIGANVFELNKKFGTVTNTYGFYSMTINPDSVSLGFSYVGYQPQYINLDISKDTLIVVRLKSEVLNEVVVNADRTEEIQESSRMSTLTIPVQQIKRLPALMGETDVIKIIQLLPGVQSGNEGSSGLYVRGGGPDQNLILLDGVPVYNISHLYGFFSIFNADAINHVELVKGGFPARYGGRLSSVLDISMKEGNSSAFHGQVSVGVIASKVMLEGPIIKNKTSFVVSARRSYLNLLKTWVLDQSTDTNKKYYFYDLNAKVNHIINNNNRIYLSFYSGLDNAQGETRDNYKSPDFQYTSKNVSSLNWGNTIGALRWNHVFSKKLFANVTTSYTQYHFQVYNKTDDTKFLASTGVTENQFFLRDYSSGVEDFAGRFDVDFIPSPAHYFRAGFNYINHRFTPGVLAIESSETIGSTETNSQSILADELSAYMEDDWDITRKIKANIGIHASAFMVDNKSYPSIQPRISARYLVSPDWSLKASYSKMQQNIHLLTNAGIGLPTDLWVPATGLIRPQTSQQGALGLAHNLKDEYELSVEAYYKSMKNVIEYKEGASYLNIDQDWQSKVTSGNGGSYGTEFFIQKKLGKINGWLGYTLSWNYRQFDQLNNGETFPYRYDRRHDAKIAVSYQQSERFNFGLTWVYGTGNAVTIPLEKYDVMSAVAYNFQGVIGTELWYYGKRNDFRMSDYHRLDLNMNYTIKRKWGEHRITLSIYNVYARKNPFYLRFGEYNYKTALLQENLFSIVPSLTYSIQF